MISPHESSGKHFVTNGTWVIGGEIAGAGVADIGISPGRRAPLLVEFYPFDGEPWSGRFWGGFENGLNEIVSWPEPNSVCVVASGVAYLGDIRTPTRWRELPPEPTQGSIIFLAHRRVVLYDRWNAYCYGVDGEVWVTGDLAIDGFSVHAVAEDSFIVRVERDHEDFSYLRIDVESGTVHENTKGDDPLPG